MRTSIRLIACAVLSLGLAGALASCGPKKETHAFSAKDAPDGAVFLAKNGKDPQVKTLPDGLQYKVVTSGPADGPRPRKGDEIKINYVGTLLSGEVFDSTDKQGQPAVMPLEGLVPGWMEALPMMHVGDVWYIYLPAKLGYGERGAGGVIPPNSVLVFKIELLGVLPSGGHAAPANA